MLCKLDRSIWLLVPSAVKATGPLLTWVTAPRPTRPPLVAWIVRGS